LTQSLLQGGADTIDPVPVAALQLCQGVSDLLDLADTFCRLHLPVQQVPQILRDFGQAETQLGTKALPCDGGECDQRFGMGHS
jgi:hypothetical protein